MRLRRSFRLGIESYRTGDKSIVIPAKAGTQDPKASSLAPSSSQGQALDPRFRGGDDHPLWRPDLSARTRSALNSPHLRCSLRSEAVAVADRVGMGWKKNA